MAQWVVRNLPEELVKALKQRAARHNRSAEQEHREILRAALQSPRRRHLAEVLALIHDLTMVSRNASQYETTGVQLLNPFG